MSHVASDTSGNALLSAARAAGPLCLNMLLWGAAKNGDRDAVRMLLDEGADREWCQPEETEDLNPCCVAAKEGHQEVVKEMLSGDTLACERMAVKAIQFLAKSGHEAFVELLLKGAPREVLEPSDEMSRAVLAAAEAGHKGIVERILLAAGLDVDLEVDGWTPLQGACQNGRLGVVVYLLISGADVHLEDVSHQRTPLFLASAEGHWEVVDFLLDAGAQAEVDKRDIYGSTPLRVASMKGHLKVVRRLLDAGAEVDMAGIAGLTALSLASMEGNKEVVKALLDAGAEVDKADNAGKTAMYHAGKHDHTEVARLLLDSGADLDRVLNSYPGATRLHWASKVGLLGMVRSLLDAGADVNAQNNDWERTPLHWAAWGGRDRSDVAELLLASGAEVDKADVNGYPPLAIAAEMGNTKVCSVLLRGGADINKEIGDDHGSTALYLAVNRENFDAALLLMQWEPSLTSLGGDEAESLESWLKDELICKEELFQEKESVVDNLNRGIEEWCNAAAAASRKKNKEHQRDN